MNILVTLDSNYVKPLTVMLHSLMISNPKEFFDIYVAHSSLNEHDFRKISDSVDRHRSSIHPLTVKSRVLDEAPVLKRISKETYYRLLAAEYLPEYVDRVLYIDPDTVVLNRLESFYDIDFGDDLIAGASHVGSIRTRYNIRRLNMPENGTYINAGVMMMNIAGLRKSYTAHEIFDYITKNQKKLYLADQDVINALYGDKIIAISPAIINMDERTFRLSGKSFDWVCKNTMIVHYDGKMKPWKPGYKGVLNTFYNRLSPEVPIRLMELVSA